jgi:hypothetical protein
MELRVASVGVSDQGKGESVEQHRLARTYWPREGIGDEELGLEWGREEMDDDSVEMKGMENEEERARV